MLMETIRIDDEENSLIATPGDGDGFHIEEMEGKSKVYVYYSEIEKLEQLLRKVKFIWSNNRFNQHSPGSQEKNPKSFEKYKSFGDVRAFKDYNRYIRSDDWKAKREQRKKLDGNKCRNCGSKIGLEVHHKDYCGLGKEDVKSDLVTLCSDCHKKVTELNRKKRRGVVTEYS